MGQGGQGGGGGRIRGSDMREGKRQVPRKGVGGERGEGGDASEAAAAAVAAQRQRRRRRREGFALSFARQLFCIGFPLSRWRPTTPKRRDWGQRRTILHRVGLPARPSAGRVSISLLPFFLLPSLPHQLLLREAAHGGGARRHDAALGLRHLRGQADLENGTKGEECQA